MMGIDQSQSALNRMTESSRAVRAYADSELSKHVVELLDALSASYCLDLMHVPPEGLVKIQAALRQTAALRAVFTNESNDVPKI